MVFIVLLSSLAVLFRAAWLIRALCCFAISKVMRTETHKLEDGYRSVYVYDDAGLHVRTTDYDSDGNLTFDIHYTHIDSGIVTGWKVFNGAGEMIRRFEVDYDYRGLESEDREYGADGRLIRRGLYFYDAKGRKIGEQHYDANDNLINEPAA